MRDPCSTCGEALTFGKYEGAAHLFEILHAQYVDHAEAETGSVEALGYFWLFVDLEKYEGDHPITLHRDTSKAVILCEDSDGFVSGTAYTTETDARDAWKAIEHDYEMWDRDGGDFEDDDDDPLDNDVDEESPETITDTPSGHDALDRWAQRMYDEP